MSTGKEHNKREMIEMEPICMSMAAGAAVTRTKTDIDEEVWRNGGKEGRKL